ncbi:MAG TPA: heme-binding domain-containing protein [Vicinamibacterales bacterium]|nr:heme-binding domain-containing protein [Vicinamibacterales bacterium]
MKVFRWKVVRWPLLAILAALAAIQLVPVDRSNPPVETEVPAPPEARAVLRRACYDCHSHETVWPWYSRVAPVSWLVARDVREGREHLNFSTWNRYGTKQQVKHLKESWEEVAEGEMPPWFYLPVHWDAVLSQEDRAVLRRWALGTLSEAGSGGDR